MKNEYPIIIKDDNLFEILFQDSCEKSEVIKCDFIIDLDYENNIIGIEIINLKIKLGENCLNYIKKIIESNNHIIKFSYDESCDAFYLKISKERSIAQSVIEGMVLINKNKEIVGFKLIF